MINRKSPTTEPRGTPAVNGNDRDLEVLSLILVIEMALATG